MAVFTNAFGNFDLERLPVDKTGSLQAWDASDEYSLLWLAENAGDIANKKILVANDSFGAISTALASRGATVTLWSDSLLSHQACERNAEAIDNGVIHYLAATESLPTGWDIVVIKIPKTLALLEHQLLTLAAMLDKRTQLLACGMVKYLPKRVFSLFEDALGPLTTSLAKKKARLIFPTLAARTNKTSPYPSHFNVPELGLKLQAHANVFSREQFDIGARFFIEQFGQLPEAEHVIDLGCGTGILGIAAMQQHPNYQLHFVDESYMALASTQANVANNAPAATCAYYASDCLRQYSGPAPQLILCNPPFHQQHSIGDELAWQMFLQSRNKLAIKGELWVVANRHLNYQAKLNKLFSNCSLVASNNKFVVLKAVRTSPK